MRLAAVLATAVGVAFQMTPTAQAQELRPEIPTYLASFMGQIRQGESHDRNVLYGGFPIWPGALGPTGKITHAASEYQFQPDTWKDAYLAAQQQGRVLNFDSRDDRDWAAVYIARRDYQARTGRALDVDAQAGKIDRTALAATWTSLPSDAAVRKRPPKAAVAFARGGPAFDPLAVLDPVAVPAPTPAFLSFPVPH